MILKFKDTAKRSSRKASPVSPTLASCALMSALVSTLGLLTILPATTARAQELDQEPDQTQTQSQSQPQNSLQTASQSVSKPDSRNATPQNILNLDLCTLAYQLYHQSLCLPLDPWYDMMSRVGSDRRDNICRFTHEYAAALGARPSFYSGPNAVRGWGNSNLNLDPILTNYKTLDVTLPAFTRDGERYLAVTAPDYITKNIKTIEGIRYRSKPTAYPHNDTERFSIKDYAKGSDHLVVFEGGTGSDGSKDPSWSLMGFVLMHKTATGYDAHIVFRGSRSGASLSKTVWRAQNIIGEHKGNPDWITDLRSNSQIEKPLLSKVGKVTAGFADSLPTMLGTISAACQYLAAKYPPPEHIYITGHSLGAGLASQFTGALAQGEYGQQLRQEVNSWDWNKAALVAYAQPIAGSPEFAQNFDKLMPNAEHYWVEGDTVVEATENGIVGLLIDKGEHCGKQIKLMPVANCQDNVHEVFVIRDALVRDLAKSQTELASALSQDNSWGYYQTMLKMLDGKADNYVYPGAAAPKLVTTENLPKMLQNYAFGQEFAAWLENVYARMIAEKSSYIGPKFQSTLDERKQVVLDLVKRMRQPREIDALESEATLLDGNLGLTNEEQWIYCGTILSEIEKANLPLPELLTKPAIKTNLDSKFDE